MKNRNVLVALVMVLLFSRCGEDEKNPSGIYDRGVFIVNEGAFGSGNGSITFYDPNAGTAEQNIFLNAAGEFAGDVVQSIAFHEQDAFIVVNGDSKVEVVNANNFTSKFTITDTQLDKPRYTTVVDGKLYISVWGAYDENFSLIDSYVLVYDLATQEFVDKIDTDEGTENLLFNGTYLFASNYNFGGSKTISVINPQTDELVMPVEVGDGPAGMVLDKNGKLWVVCVGGWGATTGSLFRINASSLEVETDITITGVPGVDIAISSEGDKVIYSVGNSIYELPITATEESPEPVFVAEEVTYLYSLSVDAETDEVWIGDAPSFSSTGKVFRYSSTGEFLTLLDAGIAPTQIVFK